METARAVLGKEGQKSNSAALSAKQLRVAAVGIHAYNFFTYRSVHLLELSVFFCGLRYIMLSSVFPSRTVWVQRGHYDPGRSNTHQSD